MIFKTVLVLVDISEEETFILSSLLNIYYYQECSNHYDFSKPSYVLSRSLNKERPSSSFQVAKIYECEERLISSDWLYSFKRLRNRPLLKFAENLMHMRNVPLL